MCGGSYYVVSGHRSTAVSHCLTGNFTSSSDINLIVAKYSHFEVYFVTPEGLKLAKALVFCNQIHNSLGFFDKCCNEMRNSHMLRWKQFSKNLIDM